MSESGSGWKLIARHVPERIIAWTAIVALGAFAALLVAVVVSLVVKFEFQIADLKFGRPDSSAPSALPEGAVVAFTTVCPKEDGWVRYKRAASRFIVGAATEAELGKGLADTRNGSNGKPLTARVLNEFDGTEMVRLEVPHLPSHNHPDSHMMAPEKGFMVLSTRGERTVRAGEHYTAAAATRLDLRISPQGDGKPHYNMPPYIALYFCEKEA